MHEICFEDILPPSQWVSKKERYRCDACSKKFHNLFRRRHHCRLVRRHHRRLLVLSNYDLVWAALLQGCILHKLVHLSPERHMPIKTCATCAFEGPPERKAAAVSHLSYTVDSDRFTTDLGSDDLLLFSPLVDDGLPSIEYALHRDRGASLDEMDVDEAAEKANEADRLEALQAYNVLYSPPDETFNIWCDLAANTMECPIAVVSFMDKDRQWFKAKLGLAKTSVPRQLAFCEAVVTSGRPQAVLNAALDPRFERSPLVESGVCFYAGAPLTTPAGHVIGTLAVFDMAPRTECEKLGSLENLAQSIMKDMEERRIFELRYRHRRRRQAASFDDRSLIKSTTPAPSVRLTPDFGPAPSLGPMPPTLDLLPPEMDPSRNVPATTESVIIDANVVETDGKMQDMLLDLLCKTTETQQHLASQQGSMFATLGHHTEQIDRLAQAVKRMESKLCPL
ncbi:hypothetical protein SPRG_19005 [Saprolegnia parasitica CBS 223.65]|uniref:Uncharacterized protein n=1 Tax=Saprolegnia parasitica (strain CBS 223.65) TaxID=695850 RepID=A0A067CTW7_SAPPC|nr:hypothetical protein SPRG_19005 [Saprolegnia parasitica CBS 223.65]KDO34149.1 hypothetical protein SPRG_19005 [Saprolegnia parasitica CBS 223.65]|eukprot:XP_012195204.1 hypothetical protein SPRG_19005 [Saprolegnia parasitica CBS 223.65]